MPFLEYLSCFYSSHQIQRGLKFSRVLVPCPHLFHVRSPRSLFSVVSSTLSRLQVLKKKHVRSLTSDNVLIHDLLPYHFIFDQLAGKTVRLGSVGFSYFIR